VLGPALAIDCLIVLLKGVGVDLEGGDEFFLQRALGPLRPPLPACRRPLSLCLSLYLSKRLSSLTRMPGPVCLSWKFSSGNFMP